MIRRLRPSGRVPSPRRALLPFLLAVPALVVVGLPSGVGFAHEFFDRDPFRQLDEILPTPNVYRTASGAPGHAYWQQKVDYDIQVRLDEDEFRVEGRGRVDYHNNSPDTLRYLWVQLDQNKLNPASPANLASAAPDLADEPSYRDLTRILADHEFQGGYTIATVNAADGSDLAHTIVHTMMRIDLPEPLAPGESFSFDITWDYPINDHEKLPERTGYEMFDDGNAIFEIAHWFPRLAPYTDSDGWQNKQFLGGGEFALEFGDYRVAIDVPADHVVAATGELQNAADVLTPEQLVRLVEARNADAPRFVVTPEEAAAAEKGRSEQRKIWIFEAHDVRDFAFASSRKFIWDAWGVQSGGNTVMAMSMYPNEAEPLWSMYSTQAIAHTIEVYDRFAFDYPYPVAISVNGPVGGMEYPMICFNGPRALPDKTWFGPTDGLPDDARRRSKYALISVIIHEVGHFYFPMIVNTDERQWTWMDEGLNSFLQSIAEREWEDDYPVRRGRPESIVPYMTSTRQVPIMTNSESLLQFGNNAYAKPAVALNILRETILGRELFDHAFREFSLRWKFRRPQPADFFRTMEDASGVDLDWFWRGWFYSTDHVDIALTGIRQFTVDTKDPRTEKKWQRDREAERGPDISDVRYPDDQPKRVDRYEDLVDFYTVYDPLEVTRADRDDHRELLEELEDWERELLEEDRYFYVLDFENQGGVVMPILLEYETDDGKTHELRIPAEIWRHDAERVSKLLITERELVRVIVDPLRETADADLTDNQWPAVPVKSRFELFQEKELPENPMQREGMGDGRKKKSKDD